MAASRRPCSSSKALRLYQASANVGSVRVYLPEAAYEELRQVAFDERRKFHDLLMEGAESASFTRLIWCRFILLPCLPRVLGGRPPKHHPLRLLCERCPTGGARG
jgi:hypothetical protein